MSAPAPVTRAIVEAIVGDDGLALDGAVRARALDEAARFVEGQVSALPVRLRALYALGLAGFRGAVLVRHARPFESLDPARRRELVAAFAWGPVLPARQLFRVIRSTALVAYYDHPAVRAALDAGEATTLRTRAEGA